MRGALLLVGLALPAALAEASGPAAGASAPTPRAEFDALLEEIRTLRADLEGLGRRQRGLLDELDRMQLEAALRAREIRRLEVQRSEAARELERTRARLDGQRALVARQEAGLARHLREAHKLGLLQESRLLLALADPSDVMPAVTYMTALGRRRAGALESARRSRAQLESLEGALELQQGALRGLSDRHRREAADLERVRERSAALLEETRLQQEAHLRAISELGRAAEELEAAIVSGEAAADSLPGPRLDVARLRGALEWPAPGQVEVPFGDVKHPRFGTVTPHPGLDIRTGPGAAIRAVLPGRVVFARRFSGYGNTVLLDHGGTYLSVYARAAVLNVAESDRVTAGQVLGQCAERGADGGPPLLYFEFRQEGRAVDPVPWLKHRPAGGKRGFDS